MQPPAIRYRVFGRSESFDRAGMRELIRRGEVSSLTDVAIENSNDWKPAGNYPELLRYLSLAAQAHQSSAPRVEAAAKTSTVQLAIGLLIAIVGIFVVLWAAPNVVRGVASTRWPATEGRLVSSELVQHQTWSRRRGRSRQRMTYEAWVHYNYEVNGQRYNSNNIAFGSEWFMSAAYRLDKIRSMKPLTVRYDPGQPSRAVLITGPTSGALFWLIVGLAIVAFGLIAVLRPDIATRFNKYVAPRTLIRLGRRYPDPNDT
jgi:hypothetical protein